MATLHPPPVDGPSAAPTTAEDPVAPDQQWQQSPHDPPVDQTSVEPDPPEDEQLYGISDPDPRDQVPLDSNPQLHSSNPSDAAELPSHSTYPQPSNQSTQNQQQFHHQPFGQQSQPDQVGSQHLQDGSGPLSSMGGAPAASGNAGSSGSGGSKIFVGGLSWETDEDSLRRYFEHIGPVSDCVIMRDRHTGHPRGFGFVTFESDEAAVAAASRRHDLDGRQVEAKRAVPRNEGGGGGGGGGGGMGGGGSSGTTMFGTGTRSGSQQQSGSRFGSDMEGGQGHSFQGGGGHRGHHTTKCKVFVGGLPSSCGADEFRSYFSQFGEVVDAQVMIDHNTGNSRGFGFVTFANETTVNAVVGPGKSNTDHEIMGKCVEVKRAEPKGAPSDRRNYRDNSSSLGGGIRGSAPGNDALSGSANGGGTNAAAAAAAAYYSNYPASLAEQYGAYYNNPQWQQYYAAMGYNFNAYPQGYNPYQQYLQAYMNTANAANGGSSGLGSNASGENNSGSAGVGATGGAGGGGAFNLTIF